MRSDFIPSFLLHSRPYRENSALVELLTRDFGRVSAVVRSARGSGKRAGGSHWRPFSPLHVSWYGRGELKTIAAVETIGSPWMLEGEQLFAGFYLNELLVRLLSPLDAHPRLFNAYALAVAQLAEGAALEPLLRRFEFSLLESLGYSIDFSCQGVALTPDGHYAYHPRQGFQPCLPAEPGAMSGACLLMLQAEDWSQAEVMRVAKHLLRVSLRQLLGPKPLQSREMLLKFKQSRGGAEA